MKLISTAFFLIIISIMCGCSTSPAFSTYMTSSELASRIDSSPIVKDSLNYPKRKNSDDIEVYYYEFGPLTRPERIYNWEKYYVVGGPSNPSWKYKVIGEISLWSADANDSKNVELIKNTASKNGGFAVVDLFRKPISIASQSAPPSAAYYLSESAIGGYLYICKIIVPADLSL